MQPPKENPRRPEEKKPPFPEVLLRGFYKKYPAAAYRRYIDYSHFKYYI